MTGLPGMVVRRVRKIIAWALAAVVIALLGLGAYALVVLL
jgi:hypothetical protein